MCAVFIAIRDVIKFYVTEIEQNTAAAAAFECNVNFTLPYVPFMGYDAVTFKAVCALDFCSPAQKAHIDERDEKKTLENICFAGLRIFYISFQRECQVILF